jgi:hypothetical protein
MEREAPGGLLRISVTMAIAPSATISFPKSPAHPAPRAAGQWRDGLTLGKWRSNGRGERVQ